MMQVWINFSARDLHGVRALYIMENVEKSFSYPIIFGSEMKMLNSFSLGRKDLNIQQFKPGHYMILDNNSVGDDKNIGHLCHTINSSNISSS